MIEYTTIEKEMLETKISNPLFKSDKIIDHSEYILVPVPKYSIGQTVSINKTAVIEGVPVSGNANGYIVGVALTTSGYEYKVIVNSVTSYKTEHDITDPVDGKLIKFEHKQRKL